MTTSRPRPWLRWVLLTGLLATVLGPSCVPGFDPISQINTLRIQAVTIDKPYGLPGEEITMRMTVSDGLGDADGNPRALQLLWLGGCYNPEGDQFFLCFEQLANKLAPLAQGGELPEDVKFDVALASSDGVPDAHEFSFTLPEDIVSSRPPPSEPPYYGIAYVFFAACAGTLAPASLDNPGGGAVGDFPLACLDADGNEQGPDSFIIGYTQVYAFDDGRLNANPPLIDVVPTDQEIPADGMVELEACPVDNETRRTGGGCNEDLTQDCKRYVFVPSFEEGQLVAETEPDVTGLEGERLTEVVWVSYFVDGGTVSPSLALVNDAVKGRQTDIGTEWLPPDEPGVYSIWAVVRDQRGGSTIVRRFVRVR
ncbi:MAG: hypothetical protein KC731_08760 [Myxococcales bacterium]|nr:hypothetical protein [Myxococcales bacterium]